MNTKIIILFLCVFILENSYIYSYTYTSVTTIRQQSKSTPSHHQPYYSLSSNSNSNSKNKNIHESRAFYSILQVQRRQQQQEGSSSSSRTNNNSNKNSKRIVEELLLCTEIGCTMEEYRMTVQTLRHRKIDLSRQRLTMEDSRKVNTIIFGEKKKKVGKIDDAADETLGQQRKIIQELSSRALDIQQLLSILESIDETMATTTDTGKSLYQQAYHNTDICKNIVQQSITSVVSSLSSTTSSFSSSSLSLSRTETRTNGKTRTMKQIADQYRKIIHAENINVLINTTTKEQNNDKGRRNVVQNVVIPQLFFAKSATINFSSLPTPPLPPNFPPTNQQLRTYIIPKQQQQQEQEKELTSMTNYFAENEKENQHPNEEGSSSSSQEYENDEIRKTFVVQNKRNS